VFGGRIADTGLDPVPLMTTALELLKAAPSLGLIWVSPRELLNIFQADAIGCHIITVTNKELNDYSLEIVKMFRRRASGRI
jgi:transaldolase